ncbi:LAMI_0G03466g1_1 [Lachancea mirantina]|uniref:Altered inheritance of mitochondria protein 32 n=1 Tax=Lachancea mirantina TaxID=1230905 RepID=A0A1G4K848_9SACH|nr:LAMI_0G03466g1_1 [Lachancea mirantina]
MLNRLLRLRTSLDPVVKPHGHYAMVRNEIPESLLQDCQCYAQGLNERLPSDKKLEYDSALPRKPPAYQKHVLLMSPPNVQSAEPVWKRDWHSKIELDYTWPYSTLGKIKRHLRDCSSGGVLINAISGERGLQFENEVEKGRAKFLVVPDMVMYEIDKTEIEIFTHFLANSDLSSDAAKTKFQGRPYTRDLILVCGHYQRDIRCGVIAPRLIEELRRTDSVDPDVDLGIISHIGGHKFAGNLLYYKQYKSNDGGYTGVDGLWFGKVTPQAVEVLMNGLRDGKIHEEWFRGAVSMRAQ